VIAISKTRMSKRGDEGAKQEEGVDPNSPQDLTIFVCTTI
jgi:hypothetical protein